MAQIECGRGHLYDPDKYSSCPYCKNNQKIVVSAARAHGADPAISGIQHSCGGSWPHHPHFRHSGDRHAAHGAPLRRVRDGSPEDGAPLRNPGDGGSEDHAAQGIRSPGNPGAPGILCRRRLRGRGGKDHGAYAVPDGI